MEMIDMMNMENFIRNFFYEEMKEIRIIIHND